MVLSPFTLFGRQPTAIAMEEEGAASKKVAHPEGKIVWVRETHRRRHRWYCQATQDVNDRIMLYVTRASTDGEGKCSAAPLFAYSRMAYK